jgi:hypothetical protein
MADADASTREAVLNRAMEHYLRVFHQQNMAAGAQEVSDTYWVQRAGLAAATLAEMRGQIEQALNLYQRLKEMLPQMAAYLDQRIQSQERRRNRLER